MDTQSLKVNAELLNKKLDLVKSLDEKFIEGCEVDDIAHGIEESDEYRLCYNP